MSKLRWFAIVLNFWVDMFREFLDSSTLYSLDTFEWAVRRVDLA
jgi:hypothetical protein